MARHSSTMTRGTITTNSRPRNPLLDIGPCETLAPAKSAQRAMTPTSVRALMVIEAGAIVFLGYWLYSEYSYNAYFQDYFDTAILRQLGTYAVLSGLSLGLTASFATVALWKSLHRARMRLATLPSPKIKGSVERLHSTIPSHDEPLPSLPETVTANPLESLDQPLQVGVADQQKK